MLLSNLYDLCYRAHCGTSFSPERRAASYVSDYSAELAADLAGMPEEYRERYESNYRRFFTNWMSAKTRCISSMITGPSRFPVERARKYNNWEQSAYEKFVNWRGKALKAIARNERAESGVTELSQAEANLAGRKKAHQTMKDANVIIRKYRTSDAAKCAADLQALGLSAASVHELLNPKYSYQGYGFPAYSLQNNNAQIKRLEDRVNELRAKAEKAATAKAGDNEQVINGVRVLDNYPDDRTQIFFDGKPDPAIIAALKSEGWRWSPSGKCWQRKLTRAAMYSAAAIIKKHIPAPEVVAAEPADNQGYELSADQLLAVPAELGGPEEVTPAPFMLKYSTARPLGYGAYRRSIEAPIKAPVIISAEDLNTTGKRDNEPGTSFKYGAAGDLFPHWREPHQGPTAQAEPIGAHAGPAAAAHVLSLSPHWDPALIDHQEPPVAGFLLLRSEAAPIYGPAPFDWSSFSPGLMFADQ